MHCGFEKGSTPGDAIGFDIDKEGLSDMAQCDGIDYSEERDGRGIFNHLKALVVVDWTNF